MTGEIQGCVDRPQPNAAFCAWLPVSGWAFAKTHPDLKVRIIVDGVAIREFSPSVARPDVRKHFGDPEIPEDCGFETTLYQNELPDRETMVLAIEARISPQVFKPLAEIPVLRRDLVAGAVQRGDYGLIWNNLSQTADEGRLAACGYIGPEEFDETGQQTAETIIGSLSIGSGDVVLEIGCGPGRVGRKISPICHHWIGTDVSSNMLKHAQITLQHLQNVSFRQLGGFDLSGIADDSVTAVYCTTVFMHLDEWDRYRYIAEMYRVLKPGGRAYADNVNLLGEEGWAFFLKHCQIEPASRPPNISKMSTPDELRTYFEKSGFTDIRLNSGPNWLCVTGLKP